MRATGQYILLLLLLSLYAVPSFSSPVSAEPRAGYGTIRGRVVGAFLHEKISGAVIELRRSGSEGKGHIVTNATTDSEGYFQLQATSGSYQLQLSHLSYHSYSIPLTLSKGEEKNVGIIQLEEKDELLGEVVVTATRSAKHLQDLTVPTVVVAKAELERIVPTSMEDMLSYSIPGVEIGSHGNVTRITMQGMGAKYINFLINGEEVAGMKQGQLDLNRIDPSNVERIEVIKGAGSALYGSNAVAGVINIITKRPVTPREISFSSTYNTTGQWSTSLSGSLRKDKWSNTSSLSYQRNGGYMLRSSVPSQERMIPTNNVFIGSTRWILRPISPLELHLNLHASYRMQLLSEERHDHYGSYGGVFKGIYHINDGNSLDLSYNGDLSLRRRYYPLIEKSDPEHQELKHKNFKQIARTQWNKHFQDDSEMNLGIEGRREDLLSDQIAEAVENKYIWNMVAYGQYSRELLNGLDLMAGLRYDQHSRSGGHLSPKLNLSYKLSDITLRASYAHAFKSPTLMELYYDWSHFGMFHIYGNKDLKPETANQMMGSIDWNGQKVQVTADYTHTLFRDRISSYTSSNGDIHYFNVEGLSRMNVANTMVTYRPINGLTLNAGYSFVHSPTRLTLEGKTYHYNNRRPHNLLASAQFFKSFGDWHLSINLMSRWYSKERGYFVNREGEGEETKTFVEAYEGEGYFLTRLTSSLSYKKRYTLSIGGDNLLDFRPSNTAIFNTNMVTPRNLLVRFNITLP